MIDEERHWELVSGLVAGYFEGFKSIRTGFAIATWMQVHRYVIFEQLRILSLSMSDGDELIWTHRALERWFEEDQFDLSTDGRA